MGRRERAMFPPKRVATDEWLGKLGSERLLCLCLNNFYPKITGKTERGQRLWVNNAVQDDFMWALDKLCSCSMSTFSSPLIGLPMTPLLLCFAMLVQGVWV